MNKDISSTLINNIRALISKAQENAVRSINKERVLLYWNIGKHIVEEEQKGKERAEYGTFLIKTIAQELTKDFGSGFSARQLQNFKQFYNEFPIVRALRAQLNWTQYRLLLRVDNQDKRVFYIEETCKNNWSARQLERQINSRFTKDFY